MKAQKGYATASVLALTAVLSLGASVFLDASLIENRRVKALVEQSTIEFALEAAFYQELSNTLNAPGTFSLGQKKISIYERVLDVTISDEQSRSDLMRDDVQTLQPELRTRLGSNAAIDALERLRTEQTLIPYLSEAADVLKVSDEQAGCLEAHFTLYRSTLNPLGKPNPSSLDGAIIRYKIATSDEQPVRTLRAIVLITGDISTPYHIMDWSYGQDRQDPTCPPV